MLGSWKIFVCKEHIMNEKILENTIPVEYNLSDRKKQPLMNFQIN